MQEETIEVKNLRVNYKSFGSGKPFLILHGWQSNSDRWITIAEALEGKFKVIVPDLPGFGKSQEPPEAWSLDNYVDWVLEFTSKIPELQKEFYLMGHSFGGALAAKFTIKYIQRIQRLFLVSASCIRKNTGAKKMLYRIAKVVKVFSFIPYYPLFRKAIYKFIIRKSDYLRQDGVMQETYLKVILDDLSYKLGFIKVPTILIWGSKDTFTPIDHAEFIHKKISHSKLLVIPDAEHALNIKVPEILSQKILDNV